MKSFLNLFVVSPKLYLGNPTKNADEIISNISSLYVPENNKPDIILFPELCITGYTCQDLFFQQALINSSYAAIKSIIAASYSYSAILVIGAPILVNNNLYNCAIVIHKGSILGVVPKTHLPNYGEFYEKRWFTAAGPNSPTSIKLLGSVVPFGNNIVFSDSDSHFKFGVEICEDLWAVNPPSNKLALGGANVILNLSASNELVGKAAYRRNLVKQQSGRLICAYAYSGAGVYESSSDTVFSGHCIIAENDSILKESSLFSRNTTVISSTINLVDLIQERTRNSTFCTEVTKDINLVTFVGQYPVYDNDFFKNPNLLDRTINKSPFVPTSSEDLEIVCTEVLNIQTAALIRRLEQLNLPKIIIGVSGGLDSTLTLLVAHKAISELGLPSSHVIGVTMPGLGTSALTKSNACYLMTLLGSDQRVIPIKDSTLQHFKDIGHDPELLDITYENVQARIRTQILYDLGNKENAINLTSSDLSESFLGWCTYNGDHSGHYHINVGIPKTLIKAILVSLSSSYKKDAINQDIFPKHTNSNSANNSVTISQVLDSIIHTPISPELLPPNKEGKISQSTEDKIGPYELHDFILYYVLRKGYSPDMIYLYMLKAWGDKYSSELLKYWLKNAYIRFFKNQFKRNFTPDGVKVGSVSLSPRTDWRMPSDVNSDTWLENL